MKPPKRNAADYFVTRPRGRALRTPERADALQAPEAPVVESDVTDRHARIHVGGNTLKEVLADLAGAKLYVTDYAERLIAQTKLVFTENTMYKHFELFTAEELGFPTGGTYRQITDAARNKGLKFCKGQDVFYLRMAYSNSQPYPRCIAATGRFLLAIQGSNYAAFSLRRFGQRHSIDVEVVDDDRSYPSETGFFFVRP